MTSAPVWQVRTDTGGTFTDCWALDPEGKERRVKVLSSSVLRARVLQVTRGGIRIDQDWAMPAGFFQGFRVRKVEGAAREFLVKSWSPATAELGFFPVRGNQALGTFSGGDLIELTTEEEAPVLGARLLTETPLGQAFPTMDFRFATTRATNALLERKGAPTVFFVTRGFRDLLRIGDQRRERLFALHQPRREPLPELVIEVSEGISATGEVLEALEPESLRPQIQAVLSRGLEVAAIALKNAYLEPTHERALKALLLQEGFRHVSLSSELSPLIKWLPRAETAVVNATLAPVMESFIRAVTGPLGLPPDRPALLMTSAGGLEPSARFHPKDSLLSGPAGGVVGAAAVAKATGRERLLTFDMGGTSTDVARIDGDYSYHFEQRVGGARLQSVALKIHTVAAGGGSICSWKTGRLQVGPESAGSDPGPACYGKGGPLTLTDVNFLLGHLDTSQISIPLEEAAAFRALEALVAEMEADGQMVPDRTRLLEGLRAIAVERMADAMRGISVREGYDPRDYTLVAFGGAGPQHACALADVLGVPEVLVPGDAGLLSAYGLHCALVERVVARQVLRPLGDCLSELSFWLHEMEQEALARLAEDGFEKGRIRRRLLEVRLAGQETALPLEAEPEELETAFAERYRELYGYPPPANRPLEVVSLRVTAATPPSRGVEESFAESESLVAGPKLLSGAHSTCVVDAGWQALPGDRGSWRLRRQEKKKALPDRPEQGEAVQAELFRNRLAGLVEEMGSLLQRTALSTNVKERLDFSCALMDEEGVLVMNAPHVPVHLGSMGVCVREVVRSLEIGPGDVVVTNHPAHGGSHLPDVTVISAAFDEEGQRLGYLANRAHHAEIGGQAPGSMPADAKRLIEEGVVIAPRYLVRSGKPDWQGLRALLEKGPYPSRALADNLADLEAQLAANLHGVRLLESLACEQSAARVRHQMAGLLAASEKLMRGFLEGRGPFEASAEERLDDGTPLVAHLRSTGTRLKIDFAGSGQTHPGNFNATPAIARSAVLYVLRLWLREEVSLNEGLLRPVEVAIPRGILHPDFAAAPADCPAVVGGNVETSQRLVGTLLKALALQASSQGTMNNLLFGDESFGYYETIGGGAGGGPEAAGASGIQVHMTNTAITDPEILEHRYPVRLRQFGLREGSGGSGRFPGGEGLVRELEFLAPLTVSLLTQHRKEAPFGLAGGGKGRCGEQFLRRRGDAAWQPLRSIATIEVGPGDALRMETPGGGGFGV
ncbi:MAG: hydantoinase B/oxoprolinase family protein [Verrucomicrobiota bacterium]